MGSMIFLAIIIVLVSGLIAYVGDLVGRKMGRKRLTLMGLRPRHTAIVISVGVGMLIAALTLTATLAVNRTIREAFFTPLGQLKSNLRQTRSELDDAKHQAEQTRAELVEQTHNQEIQLEQVRLRLVKVRELRAVTEQQLQAKRVELTRLTSELQHAQVKLKASQKQLRTSQQALLDLTKVKFDLEDASRRLEDTIAVQEEKVRQLSERVNVLSGFAQTNFLPLSFAYGQEILSGLVPGTASDTEKRTMLTRFFAAAEQMVRQRSTELPKDASALVLLTGEKETLAHVTGAEAIEVLIGRIKRMGAEGVIIRLAPVNNVPVNGPAFILVDRIELLPNTVAYTRGSAVATVTITVSPQTTTADILGSLADDLLQEKLPSALRAKGVVLLTRRFDPAHPDTLPQASFARVSWSELLAAAEQARAYRGKVSLIARAQTNVTNYGPLRIELGVEPVN